MIHDDIKNLVESYCSGFQGFSGIFKGYQGLSIIFKGFIRISMNLI